jgi:hypothetical protein
LVKGPQVCSNKEPGPFQVGDNPKTAKVGRGIEKYPSKELLIWKSCNLHKSILTWYKRKFVKIITLGVG